MMHDKRLDIFYSLLSSWANFLYYLSHFQLNCVDKVGVSVLFCNCGEVTFTNRRANWSSGRVLLN